MVNKCGRCSFYLVGLQIYVTAAQPVTPKSRDTAAIHTRGSTNSSVPSKFELWPNGGEHGRCVGEDVTGCYSRFVCGRFYRRLAGKQNAKKVLGLAEKEVTRQACRNTEEARPVMTHTKYHAARPGETCVFHNVIIVLKINDFRFDAITGLLVLSLSRVSVIKASYSIPDFTNRIRSLSAPVQRSTVIRRSTLDQGNNLQAGAKQYNFLKDFKHSAECCIYKIFASMFVQAMNYITTSVLFLCICQLK